MHLKRCLAVTLGPPAWAAALDELRDLLGAEGRDRETEPFGSNLAVIGYRSSGHFVPDNRTLEVDPHLLIYHGAADGVDIKPILPA